MKKTKLGIISLILGLLIGFTVTNVSDFGQADLSGALSDGRTRPTSSANEIIVSTTEGYLYCPDTDATHHHWYTNTSGPDEGIWYSSRVTSFRIYLHDDFMENIDLDTIECSIDNGTDNWDEGCDGTSTADGGTTITLHTNDTSADAMYPDYIEWLYGVTDPTASIELPGYNDYDGDGVYETENERTTGEYLYFNFDDSINEGTATTTSAVEIQFWYYDVDEGVWYDSDGEDGETGQHWNGHTIEIISNYECPSDEIICTDLTLHINGGAITDGEMLATDKLFDDLEMTVRAYDTDGANMTGDTEFHYESFAYGTSTSSTADGSGDFKSGRFGFTNNGNETDWISDNTVDYEDYTLAGESIYIEELSNPSVCNITYTLPYCQDLTLNDPTTIPFFTDLPYENEIDITVDSSYGDDWPFNVTYESSDSYATFDGNYSPLITGDWTVDYYSENGSTVTIQAEHAIAEACSASFTYYGNYVAPICEDLNITIPTSDISVTDMEAGNVEITWESFMDDGNLNIGPFRVESSNTSGEFYNAPGGTLLSSGGIIPAISLTSVYYTGTTGDIIYIQDANEAWCADKLLSEEEAFAPYCENMHFQNDYPYAYDDGETFDMAIPEEQEAMYEEPVVCFDWSVSIDNTDLTYTDKIIIELWEDNTATNYASGVMTANVNLTGESDSGSSPITVPINDPSFLEYTGTVCVENFEEGNYLELYVAGDAEACYLDFQFPTLPEDELLVCLDLEMDPDGYTIAMDETDAGTINVTIELGGSATEWTGNLIIGALDLNHTPGSGELFYTDGSPSDFADGHLELPVAGTSETITLTYVGGLNGDRVTAYVEGEEVPCIDFFEINQDTEEEQLACYDLEFAGDDTLEADQDYSTELCVDSDIEDQTLTVTYEGCEEGLIEYDGNEYDGTLEITDIDGDACFDITFTNLCEDAVIHSEIEDWESVCWDELTVDEEPPEEEIPVCIDLSFDTDTISALEGENFETELTLLSELEENTLIINYAGCDGDILVDYNGTGVSGSNVLEIPNIGPGRTDFDVTFTEICEDASIFAYTEEAPEDCYTELDTEILEIGEFDKFIFTFNFASEKDSYSDNNVFFSHDEDRSFYTLEYDPAGGEDIITFQDEMWDGNLEGHKGDGSDSGGTIALATNYSALTSGDGPGEYYTFGTIEAYGFGDNHEIGTNNIKSIINGWPHTDYTSFIPYIKWNNSKNNPSEMIPECSYDGDDNITTEEVCYDPDYSPERDGQVVIHNASWLEDQDDDAVIRIRYVGVVEAGINCSDESDECLTEEFENSATLELHGGQAVLAASARLVSLCSYLVTRNAGDVYLEVGLEGGSDISCIFVEEGEATSSDFRNVDALIILEADNGDDSSDDSTALPEVVANYESAWDTASICDDDSSSEGMVGNLSSYVCEIITSVNDLWKSDTVEGRTESVVSQATRNANTNQSRDTYNTWDELKNDLQNSNNPDSGILYYQGTGEGDVVTLNSMTVPEGAWTLIVEDATLKIAGNIDYSTDYDATDIPSIAFIVLGGDIYISKATREMVGVYYTDQAFNGDERSAVTDDLTIYGSIYGHVQPLLDQANYVGAPTLDGGGIVVRYDSRIILNTPPGLSEYIDVNTEQAVN